MLGALAFRERRRWLLPFRRPRTGFLDMNFWNLLIQYRNVFRQSLMLIVDILAGRLSSFCIFNI